MASHHWLHDPGFEPLWGKEIVSPHIHKNHHLIPDKLIYNAERISIEAVKRPGRGVDRSPPYIV